MAEETKQDIESGEVAETTDTNTVVQPTLEELQKTMKELIKSNETQKNEIQGLNKANSTQKTQYDELLKANETEKQTLDREAIENKKAYEDERNEFINTKAEFSKKEIGFNVRVKALELNFTVEQIEKLNFPSVEAVENYRAVLDSQLEANKEQLTKEFESSLSGKRETYHSTTKTDELSPLEKKIISRR